MLSLKEGMAVMRWRRVLVVKRREREKGESVVNMVV
jgi:hypothetical protein